MQESETAPRTKLLRQAAVASSLGNFLVNLDVARDLLSQVKRVTAEPPTYVRDAAKPLQGALRRELDQLAAKAVESMPGLIDEAVEQILGDAAETQQELAETEHYPLTSDEIAALQVLLYRTSRAEERFEELFGDHKDNVEALLYLQAKMQEFSRKKLPERLLGDALLPTLVSHFEEFLKALLRVGIRKFPQALGPMPDIPQELLTKYGHMQDLQRWQVDRKVTELFKGTPEDWRKGLLKWPKVDLAEQGGSWDVIVEAIQRRHTLVHNGGRADQKYLDVVGSNAGVVEGQLLLCDTEYLTSIFTEFETFALTFTVRMAAKFGVTPEQGIYPPMLDRIVDGLERGGQWAHALAVLEACLEPDGLDEATQESFRVNRWFCLQELGLDNAEMLGSVYAWHPSSSYLQMARAALLRDEPHALLTLRQINSGGKPALEKRRLREAPLIQRFMRENAKVLKALSR